MKRTALLFVFVLLLGLFSMSASAAVWDSSMYQWLDDSYNNGAVENFLDGKNGEISDGDLIQFFTFSSSSEIYAWDLHLWTTAHKSL